MTKQFYVSSSHKSLSRRPLALALLSALTIPNAMAESTASSKTTHTITSPPATLTLSVPEYDVDARANTSQSSRTVSTVEIVGTRDTDAFGGAFMSLNRLPADLKDIPQSVIVIDRAVMDSQAATSLASALRNVPGLTIAGAEGGQIGNNINLNGFSARTDLYLDGARDRGQYYRDTFSLQSIEVLMGPSSMLFGRGSTGGVINQVTKKPTTQASTTAQFSIMSTGLARTVLDKNVPLSDTSAFRLAAMGQQGNASGRDLNNLQDIGVAPSLSFGLGEPTTLTLSALLQHNNDQTDYGIPNLNGEFVEVNKKNAYGLKDDRTVSDVMSLSAVIQHKLTATTIVRNQTMFTRVLTNAQETSPNGLGILVPNKGFVGLPSTSTRAIAATVTSNVPLADLWVRQRSRDRNLQDNTLFNLTELNSAFSLAGFKHHLLAGLELSYDTYDRQSYYRNGSCNGFDLNKKHATSGLTGCLPLINPEPGNSPANAVSLAANRGQASATNIGLFVNDTIDLTPQVKIVAGLRGDRYSASLRNSIVDSSTPATAQQTINNLSMRAGAIWQPMPWQSYYLSYSTSFNPSLEQLMNTTGRTAPLAPQQNRAYEGGGKWDLNNGQLSLTGAIFQITQFNARAQDVMGTYTASGTIEVNGARLGIAGRLTDRLQVFGGYTFLDATIIDGIAPGTQGKTPANTPKNSASLWGVYALASDWEIGAGATYTGQRYANNTNLVSANPYVRWDATLAYKQPRYDIRLNLFNLANTNYVDALIPSDGGRAIPGIGRSAMLSLNIKF